MFVILLLMSFASLMFVRSFNPVGTFCVIESPIHTVERFPLAHDTTVAVTGTIGTTSIRITSNGVWVVDSPCPNKLCERMGRIKNAGEVLACVPNGIVVRIEGVSGLDAIAY